VALERTVTMADEFTRTLKYDKPPSIVLHHYNKYDMLVSIEVIFVVIVTGSSNDNVNEA
jgi:hypothetical protein